MTGNPMVSIIVRTKDRPKLLKRALQSIENQTYRPIEVVLVNDGGCDLDIEELRNILEDIPLNYMRLEKNRGRAPAGNAGIRNVAGEYVGFLDDDDVLYPRHVEVLVEALREGNFKISYTDAEIVHIKDICEDAEIQETDSIPRESVDFSFETLLLQNYISFMTLLFHKDVLNEVGGLDESFELCEDWDLLIRLGKIYSFHHVRQITAKYTFWSEENQVTIGNEKLLPYRLKMLSTHKNKFTPQVLYSLAYEGKFLSEIAVRDRNHILEENVLEIEKILRTLKAEMEKSESDRKRIEHEKEKLGFDLNEMNNQLCQIKGTTFYRLFGPVNKFFIYYDKSRHAIKHLGWKMFFIKARHKILSKITTGRLEVSVHQRNIPGAMLRSPRFPTSRKFSVVFIINPNESLSNDFRAHNMREYLNKLFVENEVISELDVDYEHVLSFDIVVLVRVVMSPRIEKIIQMCNSLRIPVIYDIDDYLLRPSIVDHMAALDGVSEYEKQLHRKGMRLFRAVLDAADFFTAPTNYLAEVGKGLSKSSFVIRNGLAASQIEICKEILDAKVPATNNQAVKLGYFSGTKTHQKDFAVASDSIIRIMEEFPDVQLHIGGYLDLDNRFEKYSNRIKKLPFVERDKLPYNIAEVDINIVPLEVNNPYCEAKSELKYFDSGLLEIPTVASSTDAFKWAIRHGLNGFLAGSSDEWYDCLRRLVEDPGLRKRMGQRAREYVLKYYSPDYMASSVIKIYEQLISDYRHMIGISENALKISFVVPPPIEGSGGHNKIFTAAKYLSEWGHLVTLYFLDDGTFGGQEQLKSFICSHFFDPLCDILLGADNILSCDVLCATSWITAYTVKENNKKASKLFYFVQDFESLFFPMSDSYLKAENTYRLGMHHISIGPWCAKLLKEKYNASVDHIPFSIDKELYCPRIVGRGKIKNVVFFARPEMPRRCFNLGIEALALFYKKNPQVKIILFGSNLIGNHTVPFPHENLGVLKRDELAKLYSEATVGLAFSTTNPSLVPFEMMACGCPVIDFDYNDNHINYGSGENVKLVGISPEEIAAGIEEIICDDSMRQRISENGLRFVSGFPDDRETFKTMEKIFLKAFDVETPAIQSDCHVSVKTK